jgi:alpha-L-fucosidase
MLRIIWTYLSCFSFTTLLATVVVAQTAQVSIPTSNTIAISESDTKESIVYKAAHVVPTANQYAALKNEFIAFVHFGPNTFTRMEWGNGKENPAIFDLKELHTDQWCASVKAAGIKMIILTVKHHDGFVLWQSRYTDHGIMSTPFKNGKGDVLKELAASCKKYGLKLGIYLSPADLYQIEHPKGLYGNLSKSTMRTIPRPVPGRPFAHKSSRSFQFEVDDYNEYFLNQLFELLTEYGPIHEVWFDGAHPKRKGNQQYDYTAWKKLIRTLAPKAVIFGREDIRWCGNESGKTRETEWNVIPYPENPNTATQFPDLTAESLGSRDELYRGKYLHFQQAETNTSIREGWFYRDDTYQKVRSTDDVFDIYERSVGGNSTFLLNIPPNREGKFSPQDVLVLREVGQRIQETYGTNLFANARGPLPALDKKEATYSLLNQPAPEVVITTPTPVTINRLVVQEAISTHGERVEKHALDVWINNSWKEIASGTNIGYKRILRFPEVTASKFRIRILAARFTPALSHISAHYYNTRPPQLQFSRNLSGMVSIEPIQTAFNWKPHGENASKNINTGVEIYYTTDGSTPSHTSTKYTGPFLMGSGEIKAVSVIKNETGSVAIRRYGIIQKDWKLLQADSETDRHKAEQAFDANPRTYWQSDASGSSHFIAIDLGQRVQLKGFSYTPQNRDGRGMMEKGILKISDDGTTWREVERFTFGNLINDPTTRTYFFESAATARYVRIESATIAGGDTSLAIAEVEFLE